MTKLIGEIQKEFLMVLRVGKKLLAGKSRNCFARLSHTKKRAVTAFPS